MAIVNSSLGSTLVKFTFSDDDGEVLASFRINPADIKLGKRCQEVSEYFQSAQATMPQNQSLEEMAEINDRLEEKIVYLLGYDAHQSLFGVISAMTVCDDGDIFAFKVLNKIVEAVEPEMRKRKQAMADAMSKHTAKYAK